MPEYTCHTPGRYHDGMSKIRTNIEMDEAPLRIVMERYGLKTKTAAIDLALRHLAGQPMTPDEALATEGAWAIGEIFPETRRRGWDCDPRRHLRMG